MSKVIVVFKKSYKISVSFMTRSFCQFSNMRVLFYRIFQYFDKRKYNLLKMSV